MAYSRVRETDYVKSDGCNVAEFVADSNADVANLPTKTAVGSSGSVRYGVCASGSTCHILPGSETFTGDGTKTEFTLAGIPYEEDIETVCIDGTETTAFAYDESTGKITFTTAPGSGSVVAVKYDGNIRRLSPSGTWTKI